MHLVNKPKMSKEELDTIIQDIDTILEFSQSNTVITREAIASLVSQVTTWNLLHGLYILRKILSVQNLEVPHDFAMAVILHDMAKYKPQSKAFRTVMNHYLGEGRWTYVFCDHGYASGYLLMQLLHPTNPEEIQFLFFHTKNHPWQLDPTKIPSRDLSFYIFDDIVKGVKQYRFTMERSDYTALSTFLSKPKSSDLIRIFNILKQYKLGGSKKE